MSEQTETQAGPQCYLVTLEVEYEQPEIIKGFGCHADAEAFRSEMEAYQRAKPAYPADDAPQDEWVRFDEAREAWLNAHPAGQRASGAEGFDIETVPFVPTTPGQGVVPPGWKLVPIKPTPEMLSRVGEGARCPELPRQHAINAWGLMLDAAPKPEPRVVDLPKFDGYQAHIVRELQAAFVQACEKEGVKVKRQEVIESKS